jgi:replicative DNA helicase
MSMIDAELILSKAINENDVASLNRYGITEELLQSDIHKKAYQYIIKYSRENEGNAPAYQTLLSKVPDFDFQVSTENTSFRSLAKSLKNSKLQVEVAAFVNSEMEELWKESVKDDDPTKFINNMIANMEIIKANNNLGESAGRKLENASDWYLEEFYNRKAGNSVKFWDSHFSGLTELIGGGYQSGNMYTVYGRSGRGKSTITLVEAISAAMQGANVLLWVLEMPKYEFASRALSFISARDKIKKSTIKGEDYLAGFRIQDLTSANFNTLDEEQQFVDFVNNLNEKIEGSITIRAVDDEDFINRSVRQLERDIVETDADFVVVDPIYYMHYEKNTSKTAGGDASATSKALRLMAGRTKTVILVITQAEEDSNEKGGSDRTINIPKRSQVKKTMSVLEDASYVLAFDSCDGRFAVEVVKGRSGNEGEQVEGIFLPSIGYVEESNQAGVEELFNGVTEIEF